MRKSGHQALEFLSTSRLSGPEKCLWIFAFAAVFERAEVAVLRSFS